MPTDKMPWEEDGQEFDAEKAKALILGLRADKTTLQGTISTLTTERDTAVTALQDKENAGKDEATTTAERIAALEQRAADAEQATILERVLRAHPQLEELKDLLVGKDEAEITAKADRLAKLGKPEEADPNADPNAKPDLDEAGRPKPALKPGHGGDDTAPFDAKAVAAKIRDNSY